MSVITKDGLREILYYKSRKEIVDILLSCKKREDFIEILLKYSSEELTFVLKNYGWDFDVVEDDEGNIENDLHPWY